MAIIVGLIVLACVVVLIGVALRISAAILRGAVGLTNAVMGGREPHENDYRRSAYDYNPIPRPQTLSGLRVPMPGVGYAILVNIGSWFASLVAQMGVTLGLGVLLAPEAGAARDPFDPEQLQAGLAVMGAGVLAGLFGSMLVLKLALPTTYFRAAVVTFFQLLISVALAVALGLGVGLLAGIQVSDVQNAKPTGGGSGWVR